MGWCIIYNVCYSLYSNCTTRYSERVRVAAAVAVAWWHLYGILFMTNNIYLLIFTSRLMML